MPFHWVALALAVAQSGSPPVMPGGQVTLAQDTPVELMAIAEVNTDKAKPGDPIRFRVNRAIQVDGRTVVPVGTPAFGQVVSATDAGGLGKSGRMTAKLVRVQLGDVDIPLEGAMSAKGTGAGSAGVAVLFAGLAGLFHRGNNAKIKAGEIVAGFVGEDVVLNLASGRPRRVTAAAVGAP
ncbi:hypothetical protein [Sphingomonas rubra]|uniref:Uncharacterized protein n=1 Tax=Sphingomonas rubra TaxID=634430 RepID=A0A1I5QMS0_9SPHN|nr:hypothetical protein [Sphingomonas rubra]SFP47146.1 hypothetical protein SAMN04488241_102143 [Sphingomonas rubra]